MLVKGYCSIGRPWNHSKLAARPHLIVAACCHKQLQLTPRSALERCATGTLLQCYDSIDNLDDLPATPDHAGMTSSAFMVAASDMPDWNNFVLRLSGQLYFPGGPTPLDIFIDSVLASDGIMFLAIGGIVQPSLVVNVPLGRHHVDLRFAPYRDECLLHLDQSPSRSLCTVEMACLQALSPLACLF